MDLLRGNGGGSLGNMRSQEMDNMNRQAQANNRMVTGQLKGQLDLAQKNVGQAGEANTMKAISDTLTGGLVIAKTAPAVSAYRAFHNQRVALRAKTAEAVQAKAGEEIGGLTSKINATPPSVPEGAVAQVAKPPPPPMQTGSAGKMSEVSPAETVAPDGSAPVKAPTVDPQEAPNPLKVGSAGEEAKGAKGLMSVEQGAELGSKVAKGAGLLAGASAVYEDISGGGIGGKGSNWEQKVGNVSQILGAVADVIPGGEIFGAGLGLVGSIFSSTGDSVAGSKAKASAQAKAVSAQSALSAQQSAPVQQTTLATPTVTYGRSV
tara:strand:+ start:111 stop:1070 length:960 start_codon:yes stop_codon:yes gene_type:complete